MRARLLDVNVLLALAWPSHVHHAIAQSWFAANQKRGWGTCTVTQLGFVRLSSHPSFSPDYRTPGDARDLLAAIVRLPHHHFWPEPPRGLLDTKLDATFASILAHPLVTDGYLVGLAVYGGGKLATLDAELARLFPDAVEAVGEA